MGPTPNLTLKWAIVSAGRTQREIARRARIPETRFSAIARGRLIPSDREQKRIARALGCDVQDLFAEAVPA